MNQGFPEISNNDAKESLQKIFLKIKNRRYIRSVFILNDLRPIMDGLDDQDKQKIIEYMSVEFRDEEFLKQSGYVERPDNKQLYYKARREKDKQLIFQQLRDPQFNIDNEIHELISKNESITCRLEDKIFDLLDLNEFRLGKIFIPQIELLQILISFFFHPIIQDTHYLLEQIVGSQLTPQIYQFQYYLETIQNSNQDSYKQIVQTLQNRQLHLISRENFERAISEMKDFKIFAIVNSLIEDHQAFRQLLVQKFCNLLNCTQQQLNVESILSHILNIENINEEIEVLYFSIIFYFWMKYLTKYDIEQGFSDLKSIDIGSEEDTIESREQTMQVIIQEQVKSKDDQILQHFVYLIFYFSKEQSLINYQEYLSYKKQRLELQKKINQNSSELSFQILQDLSQLQYCQLINIQGLRDQIKFFWITQINSELFEIINIILTQEQTLNLFQATILLEEKFKVIKSKNKNLIIQNILMLLPQSLSNVEKKQNILLITLYLKQNFLNRQAQDLIQEIFFNNTNTNKNENEFIQFCERFYELDEEQYQIWLESVQFFQIFKITPKCLRHKKTHKQFPTNQQIAIEQFSFSVPEDTNDQLKLAISNWVKCMNANTTYDLFYYFFDSLKRGESVNLLVQLINEEIFNQQSKYGFFNSKALFQIFYNNSNQELKFLLLKYYSKYYPVPLIYQASEFQSIQNLESLYEINDKLYYLMQKSINIINLSLSKSQSKIGKTELINNIFYKMQKFEIGDNCLINENTIDLMFDFEFNGTRKFMIADTHGYIPPEILIKVLPLFQICIIQIDSEDELQENIQSIKSLEIFNSHKICIIIRNSKKNQIPPQIQQDLIQLKINFHQVSDLSQRGIDKQLQLNEIESATKFVLNNIFSFYCQPKKSQQLYWDILQKYNNKSKEISEVIFKNKTILQEIKAELQSLIKLPDGFYAQRAFSLRHSHYHNKILKQQINEILLEPNSDQAKIKQLRDDIEENLMFQKFRVPSKLLNLFQKVLMQDHIQYLWFLEQLRQFNEKNTQKLNEKNQILLMKSTSSIRTSNQSQQQILSSECNLQVLGVQDQIKQIENELKFKKIGIEIFWRELIQFGSLGSQLLVNPIEALCQIIRKGEPFELLDGDSQTIDKEILLTIIQKLNQDKNEKVLVLSVLGPQSSGKSTLLNKLFGCHFWTSVGRCTRGVHMQLLKVRNKERFEGLFDQILLLDTEGLQSPNQTDVEFDQKMSLFVLAISDIILITVKGDLNLQFHNLIEVCIFQYSQLIQNLSGVKQIVWCFNQNNDVQKKGPFFEQIQQLVMRVEQRNQQPVQFESENKEQYNQQIDYASIIDIDTKHIWVLGFAQIQNIWDFQKWTQSSLNETFSKNAYCNGIRMLNNYVEKFQFQNDVAQLQTLSQIISAIDNTWKNIEKLPDYLEFSELLQYDQNKKMKIEYQKIFKNKSDKFDFKNQIRIQIQQAALNSKPSEEFFIQLEEEQIKGTNSKLKDIQESINEEIQQFKQTQKISKNIYLKQLEQLDRQFQNERLLCKLIITEAILSQKIKYDQDYSVQNLEKTFRTSYVNQRNEQLDQDQILKQFYDQWNQIIQQFSKTLNSQFDKFQTLQYETIKGNYNEFIIRSTHEFEYLNLLRQINKTQAAESNQEFQLLFQIYIEELRENQFRPILQTDQEFFHIYNQPIKDKIEQFEEKYCINFPKFYKCQIQVVQITLQQIKIYLAYHIVDDFEDFLKVNQNNLEDFLQDNQNNDINTYFFKTFFDFFQLEYDNQLIRQEVFENQNDYFEELKKKMKLVQIPQFLVQQSNFQNFPRNNYKRLKFEEYQQKSLCSQVKGILKQFKQVAYIISEKIEYEYNNKDYHQYEAYINMKKDLDSKQIYQNLKEFSKIFPDLMEKEKGWERLYLETYNFVYEEMGVKQDINKINNQQEVSCYDMQKINIVIQKLKVDLIQNRFNKSFSYFGVLLTKLGERCIIYFGLLIIWRFICQSQWQSVNKIIDQLDKKKINLLEKFFAYLEKNDYKLSRIQALELFETIKCNFQLQFYNQNTPLIFQEIKNQKCALDQQFIISDIVIQKDFIINYIIDQKKVINNYVENKIEELEKNLKEEYQIILANQYQELIKKLKINAQLLIQYIVPNLNIEEYFENTQDDLEKKLFEIVVCFLQGGNSKEKNLIKNKYKYIFNQQNENLEVEINLDNLKNAEIKLLDIFVEQLIEILNQAIYIELNFDEFKIKEQLLKKKIEMQGCQTSCKYCNRKCDLQQDHQSDHQCQNGHFFIVNSKFYEQQYQCNELNSNQWPVENIQENQWDLKLIQNDDQKKFKEKLDSIWKKYGQEICDILKKPYYNREQLKKDKVHYIFILDSSESMYKDWTIIKQGVRGFIKNIKEEDQNYNKESWISLILFNKEQTTLKNSKRARDIEEKIKMNFKGGGTNFGKPIKKAIQIIENDNTSNLFLLLFYTDGKAAIPEQELEKMQNLEETKRNKIQLIACTQNGNTQNRVLNEMVTYFNDSTKQACLLSFSSANDLIGFWSEVIKFRLKS
ncbi:unnamed protein product [Paramecium octaurelia]|uniref:VLIG-type G domain-containing protein n=1 Tax=Paramecium octaurelia TaxID=43137 RepID=A0A8S1TD04_PAROT|nr:unnamed protein product [Paramecium octaurelia]